ncbi:MULTISPECIES: cyclic nucleotide-binding domain-containing protein [Aphanothece]|uniref:cyclic nucleotide-binding domain-containing protein n=1 Tax=Aphanothece TaxID=1121 RepID=UPI00398F13B3
MGATILTWLLLAILPRELLASSQLRPLNAIDELLISFVCIRLSLWTLLQLPAAFGWRKQPPDLVIQLLMLAGGMLVTIVVLKEEAQFDLVGLVTTSAVLTAVLGLAAQEPLKDLFAGLELQFNEIFKVGDFIDLGDETNGIVISMNWRDTCLRDISGALVVIPNAKVTEVVLRNYGTFGCMGNRFSVGLDYALPPSQAHALLLGVLNQHPSVLADPPPSVRVKSFDDSAISYELLAFQPPGNLAALLDLRSDLLEQIWYALERNGSSVPYPVRELRPKRASLDQRHPTRLSWEERRKLLSRNPLFGGLNEDEQSTLAAEAHCLRFASHETIVREGDPGESLYQVVQGSVEVLKETGSPPAVRVAQLDPGDIFGEMSLLTDSARSATVRAIDECLLLEVQQRHLRPILQENPQLMDELARLVTNRQGQLKGLEQEMVKVQQNQLLSRMQQLFSSVLGS